MNKRSLLILATIVCFPIANVAAQGAGSFYSNVGATIVTNNSHDESAYTIELGYNHRLNEIFSADLNYQRVETLDSNISTNPNDFTQTYNTYGLGLRADQNLGVLSVYAKAGASFVTSERTTWDSDAGSGSGAESVNKENSFKPYASAGIVLASPYDQSLTFGAGVTYQMLPNGEHATSFNGGMNYGF